MTMQKVAMYPGGQSFVRTYELRNGRWVHVNSVPANMRDVAQATMHGDMIDVE